MLLAHLLGARPLGVLGDPLVGELGELALLHLLQREFVGRDAALTEVPFTFSSSPAFSPRISSSTPSVIEPDAHRVHEVGHVEGLGLCVDLFDVDVHGHEVAGDDRPVDVVQHRVGLAEPVDLGVDLVVGDDRRRNRHAQFALTRDGDLRADLDVGFEDEDTLFFAGGDVDVGLADRVDQRVRRPRGRRSRESSSRIASLRSADGPPRLAMRTFFGTLPLRKPLMLTC